MKVKENWLKELQLKQLKETEEHLTQLGMVKCLKCNQWVGKDFIEKCCEEV